LPLRHREKIKWKELVLKTCEVKKWSEVKEEIAVLRGSIIDEVGKCVKEAEEKFRSKLKEKER
jgi:hypothetical protein